jgi:hypothetical protein
MPNDVAVVPSRGDTQTAFVLSGMTRALQLLFDPEKFEACKEIAKFISRAEGFTPRHLIGKPESCFAVVNRALTWNLDPYGVASTTYQTPGGQVSYYGSLCQAIIENSGRLEGGVHFDYYGDWDKIRGKFEIKTSDRGTKYPVATWKPEDEAGLGVKVSALVRGEASPRTMDFDLKQAFPRNSTLWSTDPMTQIRYTAIRRFANSVVPSLFLGVPMDNEGLEDWTSSLKDVTPARPAQADYSDTGVAPATAEDKPKRTRQRKPAETPTTPPKPDEDETPFAFADTDGVVHEFADPDRAMQTFSELLRNCRDLKSAEAIWENGAQFITALRAGGLDREADELNQLYADISDDLEREAQAGGDQDGKLPDEMGPGEEGDPPFPEPERQVPRHEPEPPPPPAATQGPDPLLVPLGASVQAWFGPARSRVKELLDKHEPPATFKRFREVNAVALKKLENEFRSWHSILDKILVSAESGP